MAFDFADIFFGSHQKREGIPTPADGAVRIYKKVGKSFTTSGFFKKSSDIFFGATSQQSPEIVRFQDFFLRFRAQKVLRNIMRFSQKPFDPYSDP